MLRVGCPVTSGPHSGSRLHFWTHSRLGASPLGPSCSSTAPRSAGSKAASALLKAPRPATHLPLQPPHLLQDSPCVPDSVLGSHDWFSECWSCMWSALCVGVSWDSATPGRVFSLHQHLLGAHTLCHCRLVASRSPLSHSLTVRWHSLPGLLPVGSASCKGWETKNERVMAQFQKLESGPGWRRSLVGPVMPHGEWLPHPSGHQKQLSPCAPRCHSSALHSQWTGVNFSCVSASVSGCVHHVSEEWITHDSRQWIHHSYLQECKFFLLPLDDHPGPEWFSSSNFVSGNWTHRGPHPGNQPSLFYETRSKCVLRIASLSLPPRAPSWGLGLWTAFPFLINREFPTQQPAHTLCY